LTKKPTEETVTLTIRIPSWVFNTIEKEADRRGLTKNAFVNMLLDDKLDELQHPLPRLRRYKEAGHFIIVDDDESPDLIAIYIDKKGKRLECGRDLSSDCIHCQFASKIPYVRFILEEQSDSARNMDSERVKIPSPEEFQAMQDKLRKMGVSKKAREIGADRP
jgi:hypothetical protein